MWRSSVPNKQNFDKEILNKLNPHLTRQLHHHLSDVDRRMLIACHIRHLAMQDNFHGHFNIILYHQ